MHRLHGPRITKVWRENVYFGTAVLIALSSFGVLLVNRPSLGWAHLLVLLAFIAGLVVSVYLRAGQARGYVATPITLALVYAVSVNAETGGSGANYSVVVAFSTAVVGLVLSVLVGPSRGTGVVAGLRAISPVVLSAAVTTVVYWAVPVTGDQSAAASYDDWMKQPWWTALAMAVAVIAGIIAYVAMQASLGSSLTPELHRAPPEVVMVGASIVVTAVAIALSCGALGSLAILLMTMPLVLMFIAQRRRLEAIATRRQAIVALAQVVELSGYSTPGHAERVADLANQVGHELELPLHEMPALGEAALVHDLGHVMLREPVPGGTTVDLAPADQKAIADNSAQIVQSGEVFDSVAEVLRAQATQYRQVQEMHETVPLHSRIIKVCNAYDDIAHGDRQLQAVALERLSLGIGYEYDPEVLQALETVMANTSGGVPAG